MSPWGSVVWTVRREKCLWRNGGQITTGIGTEVRDSNMTLSGMVCSRDFSDADH